MAFVVETGSGLADANSYVSLDDAAAYCDDRGLQFPVVSVPEAQAALVRGSKAIDYRYAGSYPGYRTTGRVQGLEWPRLAAYDASGWLIDGGAVPQEVVAAACEAAVRELAEPGSMMPDLERGGAINEIEAGSVRVVYGNNAPNQTAFTVIDGILSSLLGGSSSGLFGRAIRG